MSGLGRKTARVLAATRVNPNLFFKLSVRFASRALPIVGRCVLVTLNTPYTPSLDVALTVLRSRCSLVAHRGRATAESVRRGTSGSPALLWHLWRRRVVERGSTAPSRTLAAPRTRRSGLRHSSRSNGTYAPLSRSAGAPANTHTASTNAAHRLVTASPPQTHSHKKWPPSSPASRT